jgi:hypothetical protein
MHASPARVNHIKENVCWLWMCVFPEEKEVLLRMPQREEDFLGLQMLSCRVKCHPNGMALRWPPVFPGEPFEIHRSHFVKGG